MGGDPIPGPHVALREWFEAFKAGASLEIEIRSRERSKTNYLHGTGRRRGK